MIAKHRVPTTVTEALAVLQALAKPATVAEALAKFEEAGIVRRTGEFQRGSITAELQPVYTLTELGKKLEPNLWPEGKQ